MIMNRLDEVTRGSTPSAFTKESIFGETVTGTVVDASVMQRSDYMTGALLTWDDGRPQEQIAIRIQTSERKDQYDDGVRGIYIKTWGEQLKNFNDAVRKAGYSRTSEALAPGNIFTATLVGDRPSEKGSNEKLFEYQIQRGTPNAAALDQAGGAPAGGPAPQQFATAATGTPAPQYQTPAPAPMAPQYQPPAPAGPQYQQQATPASARPVTPSTALEAISLGWSDQQISAAFGIDPGIIPVLRSQIPPAA